MSSKSTPEAALDAILRRKQITQRTDEWLCARKKLITATDAAVVVGKSKFKKPDRLLKEKLGLVVATPEELARMERCTGHGVKYEPEAIERFERARGVQVHEVGLFVHERIGWLGASPDGVFLDSDGRVNLVEIKCPLMRAPHINQIPTEYFIQMQIQLEVLNVECVWFVQYVPPECTWPRPEVLLIEPVARDRAFFAELYVSLAAFHRQMLPPPVPPQLDDPQGAQPQGDDPCGPRDEPGVVDVEVEERTDDAVDEAVPDGVAR